MKRCHSLRPVGNVFDHTLHGPMLGTLTLILKGEVSVRLTSSSLMVRNKLFQEKLGLFLHFQNNLILTGKDEAVSSTDTSPFLKGESSLAYGSQ